MRIPFVSYADPHEIYGQIIALIRNVDWMPVLFMAFLAGLAMIKYPRRWK